MGRRPQPEIRQQLLSACTDYALTNGLPDRLAPLAAAARTSPRMLIYHFGNRDKLLGEVVALARRRQIDLFTSLLGVRAGELYFTTLRRAWTSITGPDGQMYVRMFAQWRSGPGQLLPDFRRTATTAWLDPLDAGLRTIEGPAPSATLVLAVIRGLLMDMDATGESERAGRAFAEFMDTVQSLAGSSTAAPAPAGTDL